jgi:hypothetical protein
MAFSPHFAYGDSSLGGACAHKSFVEVTMPFTFRCTLILSALAVLLIASGSQAISVLPTNGTVTDFDVGSQQLAFEWDQGSAFDIDPSQLVLLQNEIPGAGIVYEFVIPNFYDPLPKKTIDITMQGLNPCASGAELPSVLDIIGSDSPYGSPGASVPVFGSLVSRDPQSELVTEAWEMFPNPDWEVVKIFVPTAFELESIRIETQSIPEPTTAALMAAGLLGLALAGRRQS